MRPVETTKGPVVMRELHSLQDMLSAEKIQGRVWGMGSDLHPKEILIAAQFEGAFLAGAFDSQSEMIGLIFSFPTRDPAIQHSQLLAVTEEWRGQGIGTRLKWYQRDWCLRHGIQLVRWTVDPLRAANARVNIHHLGGVASTYLTDYYGPMQGIDAGNPSDRLLLEWHLQDKRVLVRSSGRLEDHEFADSQPAFRYESGRPSDLRFDLACPQIRVPLPDDFVKLSKSDPQSSLAWRLKTREVFLHYFEKGYQITEFTAVGGPAYVLERKGDR